MSIKKQQKTLNHTIIEKTVNFENIFRLLRIPRKAGITDFASQKQEPAEGRNPKFFKKI